MKNKKVEFVKGIHYGDYVQSNENITVKRLAKIEIIYNIKVWPPGGPTSRDIFKKSIDGLGSPTFRDMS